MATKSQYFSCLSYSAADELQRAYHARIVKGERDGFIMGLEHENCLTLGKAASFEQESLLSLSDWKALGYQVVKSDRGGRATLHQKSQLVIYPILPVRRNVRNFVNVVLTSTRECLAEIGISAAEREGSPGLFTSKGKIAFVGLRIDRGVSRHGLSINVANRLEDFKGIASCGVRDALLDKTSNYSRLELPELFAIWLKKFEANWRRQNLGLE